MSTDAIDVSTIIRGIRRLRPNGQVVAKNHARISRPAVLNNRDSVFKRLRARPIKREAIAINRDGAGVPLINVVGHSTDFGETGTGLSGNNSL